MTVHQLGDILKHLSREELEAEVASLRLALEAARLEAHMPRSGQDDFPRDDAGSAPTSADPGDPGIQRPAGAAVADRRASAKIQAELEASRSALASSEARQRAIFDSAIDFAMILTDPDGKITDWNSGATQVMGWTAEQMRGRTAARFFTPEDRAAGRIELEMASALRDGRASDERWHLRQDGQRFWASGEMMPLWGDHDVHLGFVKILRDRTNEHLAGRAIEEAQARYRLAVKATNDAIWDWDLTSNRVQWNDALEQAYGHPLANIEMTGEWWIAQIHPDDQPRIYASIHAVIDGSGTAWTEEYRFQRIDGSYAEVLDRGHVIRDKDGRALRMIGAMLDLTRVRTTEAALRQSEERFRTILETIEAAFAIVQVKFDADDQPVDYRFLEANPAFERQAGVDLRGKWVTEFAPDLERFWFETYGLYFCRSTGAVAVGLAVGPL